MLECIIAVAVLINYMGILIKMLEADEEELFIPVSALIWENKNIRLLPRIFLMIALQIVLLPVDLFYILVLILGAVIYKIGKIIMKE